MAWEDPGGLAPEPVPQPPYTLLCTACLPPHCSSPGAPAQAHFLQEACLDPPRWDWAL